MARRSVEAAVEITPPILGDATTVSPPQLHTLDAIHLATALDLGTSVDILLTYDKVLTEAARAAGLTVAFPGASYGPATGLDRQATLV